MINMKREKILAITAATIIFVAILYTVIVKPQIDSLHRSRQDRQLLELKLLKLKEDFKVKDQIDEIYTRIEPLMHSNGTDQQEISTFTQQLNDLYLLHNARYLQQIPLPALRRKRRAGCR